MIMNPRFFIIGSQRSGTTLLRLILHNHSKIAIPTESTFLMPILNKALLNNPKLNKSFLDYLTGNSQFNKWNLPNEILDVKRFSDYSLKSYISLLYSTYAAKYGKSVCGDKSPTFIRKLNILSETFPEAKFIYIVRDGRDSYLSLKKKRAPGSETLPLSAIEWRKKQALIEKHLFGIKERVYKIRYEDLLQNPKKEIEDLCAFLDVSYEPEMINFWKQSENNIAKHHSELIFQPINPHNTNKWKNEISDIDNAVYCLFTKKYLSKNNYELSKDSPPLFLLISEMTKLILYFIPKRIFRIFKISLSMKIASKFGFKMTSKYYD